MIQKKTLIRKNEWLAYLFPLVLGVVRVFLDASSSKTYVVLISTFGKRLSVKMFHLKIDGSPLDSD